ncbi:glycosyltransferase family 4 protein [Lyngbya confervoides]|uniref:Glycosyltransferase family 4 protein n=1 Tax=Lyngbya confervoides BDU141951 TaxID=1574623 RepID=A0ABD4T652_9CYAN|nr:glycosyltransferase family 4 protein [Lyngbya confervoides]MCM1984212.1 glycosyltransferase family 4 protein [Lyngbya confervoides BDU141951]
MSTSPQTPATIVFIGLGWFPHSPGGNERYVYELTRQLAKRGDRIELCGVDLPNEQPDNALILTNLCQSHWPLPKRLRETRRQFLQRSSQTPDAINLHFPLYGLPLLSVLPPHIPVTLTFHGPWAAESQQEGANWFSVALKRWVERRVYHEMDRFIVLSHAFGTILHRDYGIPWDQIRVIPGGVDIERFAPKYNQQEARQVLGWPRDRWTLFTPRRLVPRMGLEILIQAVAQLKPHYPALSLAIAGKGPLQRSLEQQITDLQLSDSVHLLGFMPDEDLPTAYQAADLTLIPSQALEGFGLVLLESLACGTPVVCTPVGGMPEVLQPFSPQLITAGTSIQALAQTLQQILDQKLPLPTGADCRAHICAHYDWSGVAERVRQVLLEDIH